MAEINLSPEEIQGVINYWRNRAIALEERIIVLELSLQRLKGEASDESVEDVTEEA